MCPHQLVTDKQSLHCELKQLRAVSQQHGADRLSQLCNSLSLSSAATITFKVLARPWLALWE